MDEQQFSPDFGPFVKLQNPMFVDNHEQNENDDCGQQERVEFFQPVNDECGPVFFVPKH